jgi:6-phosphogluconolactonase
MVDIVNYKIKDMDNIKIYKDNYQVCYNLAKELKRLNQRGATVALSGGSSPLLLFNIMKDDFKPSDFDKIKFFWVDERFVEKQSEESNFGNFSRILIDNNVISNEQVFPMYKNLSIDETIRNMESKIRDNVQFSKGLPSFDLTILGLGDDGHTASLFPDNLKALDSTDILIKTKHPLSKQNRITLTKNVINNSKKIVFLCLGENKAYKIKQVLIEKDNTLPASYIKRDETVYWYLDRTAAILI